MIMLQRIALVAVLFICSTLTLLGLGQKASSLMKKNTGVTK